MTKNRIYHRNRYEEKSNLLYYYSRLLLFFFTIRRANTADLLNLRENEGTLKGKNLGFNINTELYGMEITYITEIIGIQPITEIPD